MATLATTSAPRKAAKGDAPAEKAGGLGMAFFVFFNFLFIFCVFFGLLGVLDFPYLRIGVLFAWFCGFVEEVKGGGWV